MLTLVRRQPQQPRARFAPRSPPRFARRPRSACFARLQARTGGARDRRCRSLASVHCASHKCIGHCRATSRALLGRRCVPITRARRSCGARPSLRPALPRAVRTAPPATQSPWRLRSAGFTGVDLPIFHTARIAYPTGRAGLGFHTPRIGDAGCAMRSYGVLFGPQAAPLGVRSLLDRVYALENRDQAIGNVCIFQARFSREPSRPAQGSLENRRFGPAVLWRTARFPRASASPGRNPASLPGCNAPVSGREPAAFSSKAWSGEPGTQRILRSGFLEMTAAHFAIVASAMTLEAENRRSETDPPAFPIADKPPADPHRNRPGPFAPRPSSTATAAHRLIPPAPETILPNVDGPTYAFDGLRLAHQLNPRQTLT